MNKKYLIVPSLIFIDQIGFTLRMKEAQEEKGRLADSNHSTTLTDGVWSLSTRGSC